MKPRLRMWRGMWYCGFPRQERWAWFVAPTAREAYRLWAGCQP